jgi:hypothetical protein
MISIILKRESAEESGGLWCYDQGELEEQTLGSSIGYKDIT